MKKINLTKKRMSKRSRLISNLLVASLFISSSSSASKMDSKTHKPFIVNIDKGVDGGDSLSNKLNVKYIGSSYDNITFDVIYPNLRGNTFYFVVKDENDNELYKKEYKNTYFHKKVQLAKTDENVKLTFLITSNDDVTISSKDIIIKTKYFEDVLVKIN